MATKYKEPLKKFIDDYWTENARPPTVREMATALGDISTSVVNYALEHDLGYVNPTKYESRWVIPSWVKDAIKQYKGARNDDATND